MNRSICSMTTSMSSMRSMHDQPHSQHAKQERWHEYFVQHARRGQPHEQHNARSAHHDLQYIWAACFSCATWLAA